ncbi:hypothetical protein [Tianweitania sediminis]|uniref:Uncharacterized protein n=1 Tax=Tianweitania sediminis TaxID=1502156 RepID=A0A8J7RLW3_9HYPH|nr:hypothetical protein [Tianweitania sediminis]MBP0439581.1 hypothetical protein [Tianweitania sediminis]
MAIADPFDLLADFPGWSTEFDLVHRQETSRQANGVTRLKDLGSPIWGGAWQSRIMRANELDRWRARLNALEGGARRFLGYSSSRCRPITHPGSGTLPTGSLGTIAANRKTISVSGLGSVALKAGDLIQIGATDLHRVVEDAAGSFEVRPHIWPGVSAGAAVRIMKPACLMTIVPGSISASADPSTGRGAISFQGLEAR